MSIVTFLTGLTDELIDTALPSSALDTLNAVLAGGLALEPGSVTGSTRGPLTRWFGYTFGQPRMTREQAEQLLPLVPGDPNPFFVAIDSSTQEGQIIERGLGPLDLSTVKGVTRESWLTLSRLVILVSAGGNAYWEKNVDGSDRMYWWVKVDDDNADLPVWWQVQPDQLKWGDLSHARIVTEAGDNYILCTLSENTEPVDAAKIVDLYMAGKVLKTNSELQQLLPQSENP